MLVLFCSTAPHAPSHQIDQTPPRRTIFFPLVILAQGRAWTRSFRDLGAMIPACSSAFSD